MTSVNFQGPQDLYESLGRQLERAQSHKLINSSDKERILGALERDELQGVAAADACVGTVCYLFEKELVSRETAGRVINLFSLPERRLMAEVVKKLIEDIHQVNEGLTSAVEKGWLSEEQAAAIASNESVAEQVDALASAQFSRK